MGADGHIAIYSVEKLKSKYDDKTIELFFEHFGSSVMYRQTLEGKEYITRYWGDNLGYSDAYEVVQSCFDLEKDKFNTKNYFYDSYTGDYIMNLPKEQRKQFYDLIMYLENECRLTAWEVWT